MKARKCKPLALGTLYAHTDLLSVCLSTAPEQMSCISSVVQSRAVVSELQMVPSIDPTRLSLSFRAAYSIDLLGSSVGIPSYCKDAESLLKTTFDMS